MWNRADLYDALKCKQDNLLENEIRHFWNTPMDAWQNQQLALLRTQAEQYLSQPTPDIPYQVFKLYWTEGDRSVHGASYFERRGRLLVFSLLSWMEPDNTLWKQALEDIIWTICAEPFWCIPAHFMAPQDEPLPFEEYATQLDLFSCETAFALAETLALCRNQLDPLVVRQVELQIERRVFVPFLDGNRFFRFEAMRNNWCAVCGSAIGGAALHLIKDNVRLTNILHRCLSCLDVYLDSFGEDGVSVEGVGYWTYGFGFFTCFADLLSKRTDGALNLFSLAKVQAIARCQQNYYLAKNYTVSFADGSTSSGFRMGLSCWLQKQCFDAGIPLAEYADNVLADHCYRYCLSLRDFLWYDCNSRFGLPADSSVWLENAQWLISRSSCLTLAAKAGNNGESHNHNDCGSFILCKDGEPLICDLGAGLSDAAYFGPHRYEIFINASRSHNVAMPDGCEQVFGVQYACRNVEVSICPNRDTLSMELSGCYSCNSLIDYTRTFVHDKDNCFVTLTDTLHFREKKSVTQVFLSQAPIQLEPGCAIFSSNGKKLTLSFDAQLFHASLHEECYREHSEGRECTAYLLHLTTSAQREHTCSFVFS